MVRTERVNRRKSKKETPNLEVTHSLITSYPPTDGLHQDMESSIAPPIPETVAEAPRIGGETGKKEQDEHEVNTTADLVAGWLGGAGKLTVLLYDSTRGVKMEWRSRISRRNR
jgi:hypothetical protein